MTSIALLTALVVAQPATTPAPTGRYEAVAPHLGIPSGRLAATDTHLLPSWLEVTTVDRVSAVVVQPDGRVRFELRYGPHGLVEKIQTVDGQPWTHSVFDYDQRGHVTTKRVTGPGVADTPGGEVRYTYETDARGAIRKRIGGASPREAELRVSRDGQTVAHIIGGNVVRTDRYDFDGRLLSTRFSRHRDAHMMLRYARGRGGQLLGVTRTRAGVTEPARWDRPASWVDSDALSAIPLMTPRHDVLLLLGGPIRHHAEGEAGQRRTTDSYAEGCWLNEPSEIMYDPANIYLRAGMGCICGLCVDAAQALSGTEVLGVDHHWRAGPWVRLALDEPIDVTADHHVATPAGPTPAGDLRAGDLVIDADGRVRALVAVTRLSVTAPRLGANLRTRDGYFHAGGLRFLSEPLETCLPRAAAGDH